MDEDLRRRIHGIDGVSLLPGDLLVTQMAERKTKHPARWSKALLRAMPGILRGKGELLGKDRVILDPFAGTGKVTLLAKYGLQGDFYINDLEIEWLAQGLHDLPSDMVDRVIGILGDARNIGLPDESVDLQVTSPCFGNRLSDSHKQTKADKSTRIRNTYTHKLGRALTEGSAGAMPWWPEGNKRGKAYRELHLAVYAEMLRLAKPGSLAVVNMKDFIRQGKPQLVCAWTSEALLRSGWGPVEWVRVDTPGYRDGANRELRLDHDTLLLTRKPKA